MRYKVTVINAEDKVFYAEKGENLSDALIKNGFSHPRICGGRGTCGKCTVKVNGKIELACKYTVNGDINIEINKEDEILSESGVITENTEIFSPELVLDIGTTTIALALVDKKAKKVLRVITSNNPQRIFGADVMSRIEYSQKNGVSELTRLIREEVSRMIDEISAPEADTLHVSGNTTMLHIFAGVDPTPMGSAPYTPIFLDGRVENASVMGLSHVKKCRLLPGVSAFVGADLVAGINYVTLPEGENYRLLVDLGTNAEIILFSKDKILATAAAAGPCFEGANISCGMSATEGAIYAYDGKNIKTVGDTEPRGICGTGLVDTIAYLIKNRVIDESGYMEDEEFDICPGVTLTQSDVREYQLAKSAIYSGIITLMKKNNVPFSMIESLYISGGFATKINVENAVFTGLLPKELENVCHSVGNSSLLGTVKAVFENSDLSLITEKASYVDLASDSLFSELFIENMGFE